MAPLLEAPVRTPCSLLLVVLTACFEEEVDWDTGSDRPTGDQDAAQDTGGPDGDADDANPLQGVEGFEPDGGMYGVGAPTLVVDGCAFGGPDSRSTEGTLYEIKPGEEGTFRKLYPDGAVRHCAFTSQEGQFVCEGAPDEISLPGALDYQVELTSTVEMWGGFTSPSSLGFSAAAIVDCFGAECTALARDAATSFPCIIEVEAEALAR